MASSVQLLCSVALLSVAFAQTTCRPGTFIDGDGCTPCPRNTFSDEQNSTSCTPCKVFEQSKPGARSCQLCPTGEFKRPGKMNRCRPCPMNTYNDQVNASSCIPCPEGTISAPFAKRRRDCRTCAPGTKVVFRRTFLFCQRCQPGLSSPKNNSLACEPCPVGMFRSRNDFRRRRDTCRPCLPGSFADTPGTTICKPCPRGTYENGFGSTSCKPCPPDSETRSLGAKECRATCGKKDPNCISCPPGSGLHESSMTCKQCPADSISMVRSATPCYRCPAPDGKADAKRTACVCRDGSRVRKDGICP